MPPTILSSLLFLIVVSLSNPVLAEGGYNNDRNSPLAPVEDLIDDEKYEDAIVELQRMLKETPEDADVLNLLAYSQRKSQQLDEAMVNYQKALNIDPKHRRANEYQGELYLQLGHLDKAQERLQVLDKDCFFGCKEFDKLEKAIETYRSQNPS